MAAFIAAVAALAASAPTLAPIEPESTSALRQAQALLRNGGRGRALATLDSLVMSDGVTVAMEASGGMEPSVARGIESWNDALGERPFRLKPGGACADLTVRFVSSLDEEGGDVLGFVKIAREMAWSDRSHSYRLKGTITVRDNIDGRPIRPEEVVSVVAHEAGHVLGLADVPRTDRLMGPMVVGSPKAGPSEGEVAAVREYRTLVRRSYPKA